VTQSDRFRHLLTNVIRAAPADGILLSGGLDTSVIAAAAHAIGLQPVAITVVVSPDERVDAAHRTTLAGKLGCADDAFPAPDDVFARRAAEHLGLRHERIVVTLDELLAYAAATVKAIRSFDPMQVRNGIPIYIGLRRAKELGLRAVFTGDAADEMYAGYSHMWQMTDADLPAYLRHMSTIMNFTTPDLAKAAGVLPVSPFLDSAIVNFALELSRDDFIGTHEGRVMGKWVIRQAYRDALPDELVWRVKTPIEYGSGSTFLGPLLQQRISDDEFHRECEQIAADTGLRLREKEQLHYYRLYAEQFGPIHVAGAGANDCPYCGTAIRPVNRNYCGACGAWGFQAK
jgi:asparagine synthase (glutamine-hydrolysing)